MTYLTKLYITCVVFKTGHDIYLVFFILIICVFKDTPPPSHNYVAKPSLYNIDDGMC